PNQIAVSFALLDTATGRIDLVGLSPAGKKVRIEIAPAKTGMQEDSITAKTRTLDKTPPKAQFDPFAAGLAVEETQGDGFDPDAWLKQTDPDGSKPPTRTPLPPGWSPAE
ncbi:MAG: hypothetical protein LBJ10_12145, partial [Clostridiales bacterium]|nr:hypothetical protein [Clostridiales bacterium]